MLGKGEHCWAQWPVFGIALSYVVNSTEIVRVCVCVCVGGGGGGGCLCLGVCLRACLCVLAIYFPIVYLCIAV